MSDPLRYLTSLGQALAVMGLYPEGHPARERAVDASFDLLGELAAAEANPQFSFLDGEVIYRRRILRELTGWEWGTRLAAAGVERIEFLEGVTREEYAAWLDETQRLLAGETPDTAEARQLGARRIRYGAVEVRGSSASGAPVAPGGEVVVPDLDAEVETIEWLHGEVGRLGRLPLLEAEAVVRSLSVAMHSQSQIRLPLLQLKTFDQYTTTHSSNVAVLAMALTEYLGLGSREIRGFGVAGLLHDLGKVRIPKEILVKPGKLTDEERTVMQLHPVDGARIIIEQEARLDLAAFVAYEHHIMLSGGGYPTLRYPRDCHYASKVVHVCDVYDALCTDRPYRPAWTSERALGYLAERSGLEFDPELVDVFTRMIGDWEQRRMPMDGAAAPAAAAPPAEG
ncbi:MAG TPA: HD domain-containing phosphohydrolase [Gemmatimonadales bacterium]|nr:HD domain-containing phosphohydrolase [Gemmatimonadales bacterium]